MSKPGVICPRCGKHRVEFEPNGACVAFCIYNLALLRPEEFSPEALRQLLSAADGGEQDQ